MKAILMLILLVLLSLLIPCSELISQSSSTIAVPVEISQNAVNCFLLKQYQEGGIPTNIPFDIGGVTGQLTLSLPYMIFETNSATVRLEIHASSSIGDYDVVVAPSIGIDPGNINTAQVTAFLTNFPSLVNAFPIPSQIKTAIVQYYDGLNLVVYPSRLLKHMDNTWLKERSMTVSVGWLGWEILPGALRIEPGATVVSSIPKMLVGIVHYSETSDLVIKPNSQVRVEEINLTAIENRAWHYTPNMNLTKNSYNYFNLGAIDILPPTQAYIVNIRFAIPKSTNPSDGIVTFYYRKYFVYDLGDLYGATKSVN